MSKIPVFSLDKVSKHYREPGTSLEVLKDVDLQLFPGEAVALVGESGSGKSTLLHIAGLLDTSDSGEIYLDNKKCSLLNEKERTKMRRDYLGFVYQFHHLLPEFTALENIMMPLLIKGMSKANSKEKAMGLLTQVGLEKRAEHKPSKLSGGEQQRVAIARSLVNAPKLLLADEPTGNLDLNTTETVFNILMDLIKKSGLTALIATHNINLAKRMDRMVTIKDKKIIEYK